MAISGRQLRFRRWLSHDSVGSCEIATAPLGPRNDKLGSLAPQNVCRKDCQTAWRSLCTVSAATDAIGLCVFIGRLCRLQASAGTAYPFAMTNLAALHSPGESKSLMEVLHQAE